MRTSRRNAAWTLVAVTSAVGACNAIFGIDDPEHRPDEAVGGGAGDVSTGGNATGGSGKGGTSGQSGTAGDATGGKGGSSGNATGGKGGNAGTTAGDAGQSGDGGSATGGSATGGSATGGSGGSGTCPDDPTDCEPASPPSCAGMSKQACAGESCCSSPVVPGCTGCEFPASHTATLHGFRFDVFEVTVARFRKYVNAYQGAPQADQGTQPFVPGTGWSPAWDGLVPSNKQGLTDHVLRCGATSTFTVDPGPNDQKPMNCMSWYEAFGFCVWDGGFLPTEMQRTFAAANGEELRYYPWGGSTLDHEHALWGFCNTGGSVSCTVGDITDVGSFSLGVGAFGQHDLTGSMWEWVFDYDGGPFPPVDPCDNCVNLDPAGGDVRLIRGGGWSQSAVEQPIPYRIANDDPTSVWKNVGIRCARAYP